MWQFVMVLDIDVESDYIQTGASSSCLYSSRSCANSMKIEDSKVGCAPNSLDVTKDANGITCSTYPCKGIHTLKCLCSTKSCLFDIDYSMQCINYSDGTFSNGLLYL